ncbi:MAG: hypothetical protein AB7D33_04165 [Sphingobium sp.]
MKKRAILWRAVAALLLTGLSSALVVALLMGLFLGFYVPAIILAWLAGSLVATSAALILGIAIELPKAYWLSGKEAGGKFLHVLLSVAGALAICALWMFYAAQHPPKFTPRDANPAMPWLAFTVGGLCSALWWWELVIRPWRASRADRVGV